LDVKTLEKPEAFSDRRQALVRFLGSTEESLDDRLEQIRNKIIRIFICRGCSDPEDLAQETMLRVYQMVEERVDSFVGDPLLWICGVARNVHRESGKKKATEAPFPQPDPVDQKEAMNECLERCLGKLSSQEGTLILEYYRGQGRSKIRRHKVLAVLLGISQNALRVRVSRILHKLRICVLECAESEGLLCNDNGGFPMDRIGERA
jgi:DNA-directed RNA polymerase specialized sigma24 family protein